MEKELQILKDKIIDADQKLIAAYAAQTKLLEALLEKKCNVALHYVTTSNREHVDPQDILGLQEEKQNQLEINQNQ